MCKITWIMIMSCSLHHFSVKESTAFSSSLRIWPTEMIAPFWTCKIKKWPLFSTFSKLAKIADPTPLFIVSKHEVNWKDNSLCLTVSSLTLDFHPRASSCCHSHQYSFSISLQRLFLLTRCEYNIEESHILAPGPRAGFSSILQVELLCPFLISSSPLWQTGNVLLCVHPLSIYV